MLLLLIPLLVFPRDALPQCTPSAPLVLPVTDVVVSGSNSFRGIWSTVGTPAQNLSFYPQVYLNDTWVYNSTAPICDELPATGAQCVVLRGGQCDANTSTTSMPRQNVDAAGGDASDTGPHLDATKRVPAGAWVDDTLRLGNATLTNYPIGMVGAGFAGQYLTQAYIGIGLNSTLLSALHTAGRIASRSYSWWWGLDSAATQMDGHIVFGGYDAAKTIGPNYSMPLQPSTGQCEGGMYVDVLDMSLGFPNGTVSSLMVGSSEPGPLAACLVPDWPYVMSMPETPYFDDFGAMTQTTYIGREDSPGFGFWGILYEPNNVFDGNFTIKFTNGLAITVPNDILVVSPQYVASDGSTQTNTSVRELLINPLVGSTRNSMVRPADYHACYKIHTDAQAVSNEYENLATRVQGAYPHSRSVQIGKDFFSQAYLTVNYDTNSFYLSEVNATTDSKLVTLGSQCTDEYVPRGNSTSSSTASASSTGKTSTVEASPPLDHGLAAGVIVGIAIGAVAAAAILATAAAIWCMRRRRRQKVISVDADMSDKPELDGQRITSGGEPAVYESMSNPVQEMSAEAKSHELASREKPQELTDGRRSRYWNTELPAANSPVEME